MMHPVDISGGIPEEINYKDLCERLAGARQVRARLQASLQREVGNLFEEYLDSLTGGTWDDKKRSRARLGELQGDRFAERQYTQLALSDTGHLDFAISTGVAAQPHLPPTVYFSTIISLSLQQGSLCFVIDGEEILVPAGSSLPKFAEVCGMIKRNVWLQCGQR